MTTGCLLPPALRLSSPQAATGSNAVSKDSVAQVESERLVGSRDQEAQVGKTAT